MQEGPAKRPPRFGGPRIRSFAPKSRGGCITCKKRRVKCGEEKPCCKRCLAGHRQCEGYEEQTKQSPSDESTISEPDLHLLQYNEFDAGDSEAGSRTGSLKLVHRPKECKYCGQPHHPSYCPSSVKPFLMSPSGTPYRQKAEQYLFKFFIEVAAASVARSNISAYYWLGAFPQVAHDTPAVRDTLLAVAAAFHSASGTIFSVQGDSTSASASAIAYEGRAMRALSRGTPSTAEVLNTSMAFWIISMVMGDYSMSIQHLYYSLKIIRGLTDRSKIDPMQLQYQETLARIGLEYFRTTRGACDKHGPDILDCEPTCYIPEDMPFPVRVADSLYHLRNALPTFELCLDLLRSRAEPHSHQAQIDNILNKEIRELRFLINSWSDRRRMNLEDDAMWKAAQAMVPYTHSPFEQVLADMIRYIVNDQYSTGIVFQELELRARVHIVHITTSTNRATATAVEDSLALMYYSGYTEGLLRTRGNWTNTHVEELMKTV